MQVVLQLFNLKKLATFEKTWYIYSENKAINNHAITLHIVDEVIERFIHFLTIYIDKTIMQPVIYAAITACCTALSDSIPMMWKYPILPVAPKM